MRITIKYLTLAGMLATVAWFFWNPEGWSFDWEPIAAFLLALAGFMAADISDHNSGAGGTIQRGDPNDIQLFQNLCRVLPSKGPIKFIRQHDFLLEFDREVLRPFDEFDSDWDNAEHEFTDSELEQLRLKLIASVRKFGQLWSKYTVPNKSGFQAVRVDDLKHNEKHEERFREEARTINLAAQELFRVHQDLMRKGRNKLTLSKHPSNNAM